MQYIYRRNYKIFIHSFFSCTKPFVLEYCQFRIVNERSLKVSVFFLKIEKSTCVLKTLFFSNVFRKKRLQKKQKKHNQVVRTKILQIQFVLTFLITFFFKLRKKKRKIKFSIALLGKKLKYLMRKNSSKTHLLSKLIKKFQDFHGLEFLVFLFLFEQTTYSFINLSSLLSSWSHYYLASNRFASYGNNVIEQLKSQGRSLADYHNF